MKLNFKKEDLRENFQKIVIVIGLFILVIISIKSTGNISQQNVSTVVVPENRTEIENKLNNIDGKNPYYIAYKTCTTFNIGANDTQKCINYELGRRGIKN